MDNLRGRQDSQHLEAFLTCPTLFPARIPHRGEALIDPKRFILQMSSNGLEATRDLANRASICRIRKRPGFQYRETLAELQRRQPYYLGCCVSAWLPSGSQAANREPKTAGTTSASGTRILDWIVRELVGCAPLMDGHESRPGTCHSNPACLGCEPWRWPWKPKTGLAMPLIASELVEVSELHAIEIPGKPTDEDRTKRQVGILAKHLFRDGDTLDVDGFTVARAVRYQSRTGRRRRGREKLHFQQGAPSAPSAPSAPYSMKNAPFSIKYRALVRLGADAGKADP